MYHFCEYMKHFFKMLHILHSEKYQDKYTSGNCGIAPFCVHT